MIDNNNINSINVQKYINSILSSKIDFSNIKESLKEFQDTYNECENDDEKYNVLMNFNNTLEEFINTFCNSLEKKEFDNETVLEKLFLYTNQLFKSYAETSKLQLSKGDEVDLIPKIKENIKKYITVFIDKSSGYLNILLESLEPLKKKGNLK